MSPTKNQPPGISPRRIRKIRRGFLIFHVISSLLGLGMIILALLVRTLESRVVQQLHLDITARVRVIFYTLGVLIVLNSVLGLVALFKKKKAYLWMIYCTILGCLVLVTFTASGSAFTLDLSLVQRNMLTLMQNYEDDDRRKVIRRSTIQLVDHLQETYKCCGVNSFKDWQDVEFGRTSLKVPRTCCKLLNTNGQLITSGLIKSSNISAEDLRRYRECGLLCLPDHLNSGNFLHTRGCFGRIFGTLRMLTAIMGWFGLTVGILFAIGFLLTAYLIGSNGI